MVEEPVWICATCGVEHERANGVCAICADERQWVPADGQKWTTVAELAQSGRRVRATEGVLLVSDTIHANPDRATVTFLRSYPNRIPLSAAVVERLTRAVQDLGFDRLYDNFGRAIDRDAAAAVRRSADRYCGWVRGDFDHLT